MRTLFSYTPRSGNPSFAGNMDQRIAMLDHGNASVTYAGDLVSIQVGTAYPGNHYRHEMRSFCEQYLARHVGVAIDEQGTITLAVPTEEFAQAWAMLDRFVPEVAQDEWCHKELFRQGAMSIWGEVLALAPAAKIAGVITHRPDPSDEAPAWERNYHVDVIDDAGNVTRVTDAKYGVSFERSYNCDKIQSVTWDHDQPIEEFTPGTIISLDCSRHADRLLMAAAEYTREFEYIPSIVYSKIRVLRRLSGMVVKLINKLAGHENLAWEEEGPFIRVPNLRQAPFTVPDYKNPVTISVDERTFLRSVVQISKTQAIVEACEKLVK